MNNGRVNANDLQAARLAAVTTFDSISKTDTRILKRVDAAGTVLAELAAPPGRG